MYMQMLALLNRRDHLAVVHAVLDDVFADLEICECNRVTNRNVTFQHDVYRVVWSHRPADGFLAAFAALDNDDANAVTRFMH